MTAIEYGRSGTGDIDSTLQALTNDCSNEYEIAIDYLAHTADTTVLRIDSCDELRTYGVRTESVTLLEQDGLCTADGGAAAVESAWPEGGLAWDKAHEHTGTIQRVCGPLKSVRETSDGTFVNVGVDYPSAGRFTFIFWDAFLDPIEADTTVCGSGEIYLYEGVTQMEMGDPSSLELWR